MVGTQIQCRQRRKRAQVFHGCKLVVAEVQFAQSSPMQCELQIPLRKKERISLQFRAREINLLQGVVTEFETQKSIQIHDSIKVLNMVVVCFDLS